MKKINKNNKLLLGGAALALALTVAATTHLLLNRSNHINPTTNDQLAQISVSVTNLRQNSGGSGVILSSSDHGSLILTNRHVCGVIENGGIVRTDNGNLNTVVSYTKSRVHDLCAITVAENLGTGTNLANGSPETYDSATIVGHPALLPTTVTKGHFSGSQIITLMAEVRKCTKEDLQDPALIFFCEIYGTLPVYKSFQAQHVTATIMPGSSGSPVFNRNGELTGLVFAGMGQLGYAMIVPSDYVRYFLKVELKGLSPSLPDYEKNSGSRDQQAIRLMAETLRQNCEKARRKGLNVSQVCPDLILSGDDLIKN